MVEISIENFVKSSVFVVHCLVMHCFQDCEIPIPEVFQICIHQWDTSSSSEQGVIFPAILEVWMGSATDCHDAAL